MYSLYYVLTDQHRDEFAPIRCSEQTIARLVRCFEDVVTENNLSALVIEGRCLSGERSRETKHLKELAAAARQVYLFSCDSECEARTWEPEACSRLTTLAERGHHNLETGPFILVMEPRFSGLLASCDLPEPGDNSKNAHEMIWTFDPNVVFTAIEYVLARVSVQAPQERERLEAMLNACTLRSSSLRLALDFTTKVTMVMQRQNELEMATNRISSAISGTLELEEILQAAVEEVGRALDARRAALVLWQEGSNLPEGMSVYERPETRRATAGELAAPVSKSADSTRTSSGENDDREPAPISLEMPISYRDTVIGVLVVEDDTIRDWEDEEVLMLKTVADQLSVAISHARLFRHIQNQAMTDALTGLYNHRYFQERLNRETRLADRNDEPVSLILLDLDHLKEINDTHGHRSGDAALLHVASTMKSVVRNVDISARYGGEEFVVILPQCTRESALEVAERLREAVASTSVPRVGQVTASFGVATYPSGAKSKEELVEMADRAMYLAKAAGRNRVRTLAHRSYTGYDVR
jgi:diguanylate cyclase (GGDEF)-like protein